MTKITPLLSVLLFRNTLFPWAMVSLFCCCCLCMCMCVCVCLCTQVGVRGECAHEWGTYSVHMYYCSRASVGFWIGSFTTCKQTYSFNIPKPLPHTQQLRLVGLCDRAGMASMGSLPLPLWSLTHTHKQLYPLETEHSELFCTDMQTDGRAVRSFSNSQDWYTAGSPAALDIKSPVTCSHLH